MAARACKTSPRRFCARGTGSSPGSRVPWRRSRPVGGRAARALAELSTAESSRFDRLLLEAFALAARSPEAAEVLSSSMNVFLDGLFEQVSAAVESGVIDPSLSRDALRHLFASWMFGAIVSRTLGVNRVPIDDMNVLYARVADALRPS